MTAGRHRRRRRHARQLDDVHRPARPRPRRMAAEPWPRELRGRRCVDADLAALEAEIGVSDGAERPAQGRADPARRPRSARRRRDPAERHRLRRLRPVRLRLPAGREAVGDPRAPRRGVAARDADRPRRAASSGSWSEEGRAAGVEATSRSTASARRLVVRAPQVVARGRRAAHAGRARALGHRPPGHGSPSPHPPGRRHRRVPRRGRRDVARDDAGGAGAPPPRPRRGRPGDGPGDAPSGFIVESAPGTPGLIALVFPVGGPRRVRGADGPDPPRRPDHRRSSASAARARSACRVPGGRGSTTPCRRRTARRSARCSPRRARIAWEGGSREMVAVGTPPRWFRADRDGDERRSARGRRRCATFPYEPNRGTVVSAHQMGSARAGDDPARTRRTRRPHPAARRPTGPRPHDPGPVRRRRVRVPERPGREPDDDDDGVGAAGRPDGARGGCRARRLGRAFLGARRRPGARAARRRRSGSEPARAPRRAASGHDR